MDNEEIFYGEYGHDDLYDLMEDITDALSPLTNENLRHLPVNRKGHYTGTFNVSITWSDDITTNHYND